MGDTLHAMRGNKGLLRQEPNPRERDIARAYQVRSKSYVFCIIGKARHAHYLVLQHVMSVPGAQDDVLPQAHRPSVHASPVRYASPTYSHLD